MQRSEVDQVSNEPFWKIIASLCFANDELIILVTTYKAKHRFQAPKHSNDNSIPVRCLSDPISLGQNTIDSTLFITTNPQTFLILHTWMVWLTNPCHSWNSPLLIQVTFLPLFESKMISNNLNNLCSTNLCSVCLLIDSFQNSVELVESFSS